jgi:hypothetical protein
MGEVYRATHARLGREVALKGLPAAVAQDPERGRWRPGLLVCVTQINDTPPSPHVVLSEAKHLLLNLANEQEADPSLRSG